MRLEKLSKIAFAGGLAFLSSLALTSPATYAASPETKPAARATVEEEEPKGDPIDVDKLPKAVVDAVKKDMPGARITKAAKLEDGNFYLDDVKVGKKLWDVTVSPKGKIIKKVEMKD